MIRPFFFPVFNLRSSFTLIELLIVIAIVAVLSAVVILTLNPAQLLKQARDSTRLSDLATLNQAISLYQVDQTAGSLGAASTTYVSIPDPTATTTNGTDCSGLGLSAPSGWTYKCAASSTYRNSNGTGWIPVNFMAISAGSSLANLPVDPTNTSSSGLYYTYTPGGSWALTAMPESTKYISQASSDIGFDPGRIEMGSDLSLVARSEGLVGWWTFDEGSGTVTYDHSGHGNNGSWSGTGPVHYGVGKVGSYAGQFNGTNDYINAGPFVPDIAEGTLSFWLKTNGALQNVFSRSVGGSWVDERVVVTNYPQAGKINIALANGTTYTVQPSFSAVPTNTWVQVSVTWRSGQLRIYLDGALDASYAGAPIPVASGVKTWIGRTEGLGPGFFSGLLDEFRIYNRALSAAEIRAIYNATK